MSEEIEMLISKLKQDLKAHDNFLAILNKAEQDGYIKPFIVQLTEVFHREI